MLSQLFDRGSNQVLEQVMYFTEARNKVLGHNIANIDTPRFIPETLTIKDFQNHLGKAIDDRRTRKYELNGKLNLTSDQQIRVGADGQASYLPQRTTANILFHDQNNRSIENIMKDLAENNMAHQAAIEMWKKNMESLNVAISERV